MHPICKANEWKGRMNSIMKILSLEDSDINQTSLYSRSYACGEIVSARSFKQSLKTFLFKLAYRLWDSFCFKLFLIYIVDNLGYI